MSSPLVSGARYPQWSPDGTTISYITTSNLALWLMNADGTNKRLLFDNPRNEVRYTWSADGSQIYIAEKSGGYEGLLKIINSNTGSHVGYRWASDGTEIKGDVMASPIDNRVAFLENPSGLLRLFVLSGSNSVITFQQNSVQWADWSPDSSKLAYSTSGGDIFVTNSDGSGGAQYLAEGNRPIWSPDGSFILFLRNGTFFIMNADGSNQISLNYNYVTHDTMADWK